MIQDKNLMFSSAQAVTSTARSTNVIDQGATAAGSNLGKGNDLVEVFIQVVTTFTTSDAATLAVSLCTDSDETISNGTVLVTTPALAVGTLVAGYQVSIGTLPVNVLRYLDLNYTVGTGTFTAGKITAGLILDRQTNQN